VDLSTASHGNVFIIMCHVTLNHFTKRQKPDETFLKAQRQNRNVNHMTEDTTMKQQRERKKKRFRKISQSCKKHVTMIHETQFFKSKDVYLKPKTSQIFLLSFVL